MTLRPYHSSQHFPSLLLSQPVHLLAFDHMWADRQAGYFLQAQIHVSKKKKTTSIMNCEHDETNNRCDQINLYLSARFNFPQLFFYLKNLLDKRCV